MPPIIGQLNKLEVVKELEFGMYLDGGELGEILLPRREISKGTEIGESLDVFLYFDSEDRIIATTIMPYAMVGDFALLRVKSVNQVGAFMDWGLMKDLLVPFREQKMKMEEGRSYIVHVYYDEESNRIAASAKLSRFLDISIPNYHIGQEVNLLVWQQTDLGYKVIINERHQGMIYANDIFQGLNIGEKIKGFIKNIREDQKIDVCLFPTGYAKVKDNLDNILDFLKAEGGFAKLTDKSPPEIIYDIFGISKKTFKSAIGTLYKQKKIVLEKDGIRLV